jgi:hypothetical protein
MRALGSEEGRMRANTAIYVAGGREASEGIPDWETGVIARRAMRARG